jgi:hypothetical protein
MITPPRYDPVGWLTNRHVRPPQTGETWCPRVRIRAEEELFPPSRIFLVDGGKHERGGLAGSAVDAGLRARARIEDGRDA